MMLCGYAITMIATNNVLITKYFSLKTFPPPSPPLPLSNIMDHFQTRQAIRAGLGVII